MTTNKSISFLVFSQTITMTVFALAFVTGCASSGVSGVRGYAIGEQLPRPGIVLVYDFAVSSSDVKVDVTGPGGTGTTSERARAGQIAKNALANELVKKIREIGLNSQRANINTSVPLNALMIKGKFVTVDEGDMSKRTVIGFGFGASEIRTQFLVYQQTVTGPRLLGEAAASAEGSKKPGMILPGVGAAATGAVVGLAVGGALTVATEVKGSVEADAQRNAQAISEILAEKFASKGWI